MQKTFCDRCSKEINPKEGRAGVHIQIYTQHRNGMFADLCYPCTGDLVILLADFAPAQFKKEIK